MAKADAAPTVLLDPNVNWKDLYIEWITEKRDHAASKGDDQTFMERNYNRVLKTLKSTPIKNELPSQLKKLPGIGEKSCKLLAEKAKKYCEENNLSVEWCNAPATSRMLHRQSTLEDPGQPAKKQSTYIPKYGTTAYNILCGIRQLERLEPHAGGFGKDAITRFLKTRLMRNDASTYAKVMPTLNAGFAQLNKRGLVSCRARRYCLEEDGRIMADKFLAAEKKAQRDVGGVVSSDAPSSPRAADGAPWCPPTSPPAPPARFQQPSHHTHTWSADEFVIKMALDNREVSSHEHRDGFRDALRERGIDPLVLPLPVGDCCWVAEHKRTGKRAVLNYILERKCASDLVMSIMDGRFLEQKARLQRSQLAHLIYLVEITAAGDVDYLQKHKQRMRTAMSQTLVHSEFYLRQTSSQNETVLYLQQMTLEVQSIHANKPLVVVTPNVELYEPSMQQALGSLKGRDTAIDYDSFFEATSKSRQNTVAEVFVQMLMAVRGISAEKALAIQEIWKTPRLLVEAYAKLPEHERPAMVSDATQNNVTRRKIRLDLSRVIAEVWGSGDLSKILGRPKSAPRPPGLALQAALQASQASQSSLQASALPENATQEQIVRDRQRKEKDQREKDLLRGLDALGGPEPDTLRDSDSELDIVDGENEDVSIQNNAMEDETPAEPTPRPPSQSRVQSQVRSPISLDSPSPQPCSPEIVDLL